MHITVDKDRCIGGGQCVLSAPELFDQEDDDGTVILLGQATTPEEEQDARLAARVCPAVAIEIQD